MAHACHTDRLATGMGGKVGAKDRASVPSDGASPIAGQGERAGASLGRDQGGGGVARCRPQGTPRVLCQYNAL